tara:strand:+ start:295 stop:561 length:267 start_codon:yes stop_codon:yes gene_type:complete
MVTKQKEQKEHLTNSMKLLENEIQGVSKEIQKMTSETTKIKVKLFGSNGSECHGHGEGNSDDSNSDKTANSPIQIVIKSPKKRESPVK